MTDEEFANLHPGDVIRHIVRPVPFYVLGNYGGRVIAVNVADITNAGEWVLLRDSPSYLVQKDDIRLPIDLLKDIRTGIIEALYFEDGLDGGDGTYLLGRINNILGIPVDDVSPQ